MGQISPLKKNMMLSVMSQAVSFFVSLVLNLVLPKFIDELQYSYWQMFLLYVSFVPLLHFGFLDGLMLRYSQYDYESLDKPLIRSQFKIFFIGEVLLSIVACFVSYCVFDGIALNIAVFISIAIVTTNLFTYTSYTFQLTNRISKYALLVIVQRVLLCVGVLLVLFLGARDATRLCVAYMITAFVTVVWGYLNNQELYFGKSLTFKQGLREVKENVFSGANLLIANLSAMLLVSGAKMFVQWHYDALLFGQVAFSFNVSNLFLTFVTAASVAVFPSIKRIDSNALSSVYLKMRRSVLPILLASMVLYFPGCEMLKMWLPAYSTSMEYLCLLMPIIVFSSKISLLSNNYLKAFRKERLMLIMNLCAVLCGFILFSLAVFYFGNVKLLLLSLVFVVAVLSTVSEVVVMRLIGKTFYASLVLEIILSSLFLFVAVQCTNVYGMGLYAVGVILYFLVEKKRR